MITPRTAIMTGASPGIGASWENPARRREYDVVATSRSMGKIRSSRVRKQLALVDGVRCGRADTTKTMAGTTACERWGDIDTLVNNASVTYPSHFLITAPEDIGRLLRLTYGFIYLSQLVVEHRC